MSITFPDGFLWGTATAAHQVEGSNWNNNWWEWEHNPASPCVDVSGDACDHYTRYPADIALLRELGFGAYRFSLEWSRMEPERGEWSRVQLDHYKRTIATCRENELLPVVTFHHFTDPRWIAAEGGWENPQTVDEFARFCEYAVNGLGDDIGIACTLNEPNVVAMMGYILGQFPPGAADFDRYLVANDLLRQAHDKSRDILKAGPGNFPVGMTLSMADWYAEPGGEDVMAMARNQMEDVFLESAQADDYVGAQMYTRITMSTDGLPLMARPDTRTTLMGYEFWPQAAEATVRYAAEKARVPVIVTENGIATADDAERIEYVTAALEGVKRCIDDGIDVRGYFYWSCLDNFEWAEGWKPAFGLVAVDRATQQRTVKPSARWLGRIARTNRMD
ncbi:MAG: glycoside hydrolase family 1 protein [Acidimicrobiia bacterium]